MKPINKTLPLLVFSFYLLVLFSACQSEQKVASYEDLYKERPVTVLVAPVQDNAKRPMVKTSQDEALVQELASSALFMRQTLSEPLVTMGYYTLPPLASDVILDKIGLDYKQLMNGDIRHLDSLYHIDAVLLVAIHKWQTPEVNELVVYAEYTLRSTKTGMDLMHTWVRGNKIQPVDTYGEPIELPMDIEFMDQSATGDREGMISSRMTHRCILMQQMSDFVLRNLPFSSRLWYHKHDQYIPANPSYYGFIINPDGSLERREYTEDAFGNECFTD